MTEQTSGAEKVRIPSQGRSANGDQDYRPRHRGTPATPTARETFPQQRTDQESEPRVVPPAALLAHQRQTRAARARASTASWVATTVRRPTALPQQTEHVYETPPWVRPPRPDQPDESYLMLVGRDVADRPLRPEGMIRHARWTSPRGAAWAAAFLLVGFLAAAVASGSGTLRRQSTPMLALTLACVLGAAGVYALLVVLRPVIVELNEQWLLVRHGDQRDRFNLAGPFERVQTTGQPGTRKWRLLLGSVDGRTVRLNHRMVDSRSLAVVVEYCQALASRERDYRDERFNR